MSTPAQPTPSQQLRDENGRLTSLCFDPGTPLASGGTRWLVAIDGSAHSLHALGEAIRMAGQLKDCSLDLITVQRWLSREAAETELGKRGWQTAEKALAQLAATTIPWRLHVAMGEAAETIVEHATRLGCQTIVVGSRGLTATENLLIGSVAYKIIHLSPTSVWVVR